MDEVFACCEESMRMESCLFVDGCERRDADLMCGLAMSLNFANAFAYGGLLLCCNKVPPNSFCRALD